jgi:hypothetical protein
VFTRRSFTIVVVANDNPLNAFVTVLSADSWDGSPFAREDVLDVVGLVVSSVDGTDQAVLGDVFEMAAVLEPWATSRD